MHARYYDPNVGRFLSVDPVLNQKRALHKPQTWNRYSYVENTPLMLVDPTGKAVQATFDLSSGVLVVRDVDTGKVLRLMNVFSGAGSHKNKAASGHVKNEGPVPVGKYLIGRGYPHEGSSGDNHWYRLYGQDGTGKYRYDNPGTKVVGPRGETVYRDGMNLHCGLVSIGCVTVPSQVPHGHPEYPRSDDYDRLKKMLDDTKPLMYKGSPFSGWLAVQE